jgi:hypothetical protein
MENKKGFLSLLNYFCQVYQDFYDPVSIFMGQKWQPVNLVQRRKKLR